jgi:hypothetical protein
VEKEEKVRVVSMRARERERARERSWLGANAGTR